MKINTRQPKIVIAIDSFKGSLSSLEAARAVEEGILSLLPQAQCDLLPMADGGEGLLEALQQALGLRPQGVPAHDPLMRPLEGSYLWGGRTALVELASVGGLPLLGDNERNPWKTTTYGVGELLADALKRGARRLIVGLGGSATNDGGVGLLQALGVRFLDREGQPLMGGGEILGEIQQINTSRLLPEAREAEWILVCDVDNPLCGPEGASRVYAPQKGATPEMVEALEHGMAHYAERLESHSGVRVAELSGGGAAGGVAAGIVALLGAKIERGFEWISGQLRLEERIASADLVLTGEGRIDEQSLRGKLPFGVAERARRHQKPCVALCGSCSPLIRAEGVGFEAIYVSTPEGMPLEEAMHPEVARANLRNAAARFAADLLT